MSAVVASGVADGQVVLVAAAALALGADVLQRGLSRQDMLATHPAGHNAMELAGYSFVDFFAGKGESAHGAGVACVAQSARQCALAILVPVARTAAAAAAAASVPIGKHQ